MKLTIDEILFATGGRLAGGPDNAVSGCVSGVSIDSRTIRNNELFVPIVANRDGHEWIPDAVASGASTYLFETGRRDAVAGIRPVLPGLSDEPAPTETAYAIEVTATEEALISLGRWARSHLSIPVIGITGSVGKTSTKDFARSVLSRTMNVSASFRSYNNELGVPLTLVNSPPETEVEVIEMGARGMGHIAMLCSIARPTMAVVTSVAPVHMAMFHTLSRVALAKAELVEAIDASGHVVLNVDDPLVAAMSQVSAAPIVSYSAEGSPSAEVAAESVTVDSQLRASFVIRSSWGSGPVRLQARGAHQVANALGASCAGLALGVPLEEVCAGLGSATISPGRMEILSARGGGLVINDAYNGNPTSMMAGLTALAGLPAGPRVAVLGEMAELGEIAGEEHLKVARIARDLGIRLIPVGTDLYGVEPYHDLDEVALEVGAVERGTAVLVKASLVAGLEPLARRLAAQ